jgi:hypothetical protein
MSVVNPQIAPRRLSKAVSKPVLSLVDEGERLWLFVLRDTTVPLHERFGYAANL